MKKTNDIGELFRNQLQGMEVEPSSRVWESIAAQNIQPQPVKIPIYQTKGFLTAASGITMAGLVTLAILFWPSNRDVAIKSVNSDQTVIIQENEQNLTQSPVETPLQQAQKSENRVNSTGISPKNPVFPTPSNTNNSVAQINSTSSAKAFDNHLTNPEPLTPSQNQLPEVVQPRPMRNETAQQSITNQKSNVIFSPTQKICLGQNVTLYASGGVNYLWSTGQEIASIIVSPIITTVYSVTVTEKDGSKTEGKITVYVEDCNLVNIPNAFTPNSDGNNDVFKPVTDLELTNFTMRIYSSRGEKLFESRDIHQGWDGTRNGGALMDPGAYVFYIKFTTSEGQTYEKRGTVMLIR